MIENIKSFCKYIGIDVTDEVIKEWQTRKLAEELFEATELLSKMVKGEVDGDQYLSIGNKTFSIFDREIIIVDEEFDDEE